MVTVLGIDFHCGTASDAVAKMKAAGGLLVVPAAPALARIDLDPDYRDSLLCADMAIADSVLMVITWALRFGVIIPKVSGLAYLRVLLRTLTLEQASSFWVFPSEGSSQLALDYLKSIGLQVGPADYHVSPQYGSVILDEELIRTLNVTRPSNIIIGLGGGVQERLGHYIREKLQHRPAIHCIGAAIGFLSGDQVFIPTWADQVGLGWLFRCFSDPARYVRRYASGWRLVPLVLRYGSDVPPLRSEEKG